MKEGPSVDASIPLRRGEQNIAGGKVKEGSGEQSGEKKEGAVSGMEGTGEKHRGLGRCIEICSSVRWGMVGTTIKSQTPGMWEVPRTQWG